MINTGILNRLAICIVAVLLFVFLTACNNTLLNSALLKSSVIDLYVSPNVGSYNIRSVSLLPVMPDDTTDAGAFYATNHFINSLEKRFPKIKFVVADIDTAIASDSMAITESIESIERIKRLDLRKFYESELGYDVQKDSADAMIIGKIDSCTWRAGLTITGFHVYKSRILSCYFTYYLISLKDGRVLWKASTLGEEGYTIYFGAEEIYPPLDYALSNGIDLFISEIPLE